MILRLQGRRRVKRSAIVWVLLVSVLGLWGVSAEGADADEYRERFTLDKALQGMTHIGGWLKSFQTLNLLAADRITAGERAAVGNLDWETQNLGFHNWSKTVEGTLLRQERDICRLEYELAMERYGAGKGNYNELISKERKNQAAQQQFQDFLTRFHVAD